MSPVTWLSLVKSSVASVALSLSSCTTISRSAVTGPLYLHRSPRNRYKHPPFCACKGKGSPYSITERVVLELIPVLGSQPAGDVSHKPGGRLPLLSARPAVALTTLKRAATIFAAW